VRRAWSAAVGAAVYAQPLVVGGTVIVAGEDDVVSALRASDGRLLWRRRLGTPVDGGSLPCGNIDPSGITGTPVADRARGLLYVVGFLSGPRHVLFALDLRGGAVRWQRPIDPPGADPAVHQQRAALALSRGRVYVSYGGLFGDCGPYHGWVVGASGRTGPLVSYRVPTAREAGIWAPPGPSIDAAGNLYVATGNGASTTSFDYGNAVIRLSPALRAQDYFTPRNGPALSSTDTDLGSTSPVLIPSRPTRAFVVGKEGVGYLLDAHHLGGVGHARASRALCGAGAYGGIAYARGRLYVPCADGLVAVRADSGLEPVWRQAAVLQTPVIAGPGVWGIGGSALNQLDPGTGRVRFRADIGTPAHFAAPAAAGGRVFVAAGGRVQAFAAR
jgi:outer membrane protein assembly factor BamB